MSASQTSNERAEVFQSIRAFAQDCIENGHDRGSLGNLFAIRDLCDAQIESLARETPDEH